MSISPISTVSLYSTQLDFYKNLIYNDTSSIDNMLIKNGITPSGDKAKDAATLQEIIKNNTVQNLQGLNEDSTEGTDEVTEQPWFSTMYELGLSPTGDAEKDYNEIIDELTDRIQSAQDPDDYGYYKDMLSYVQDLFISSGVPISELQEGTLPFGVELDILANYNKSNVENADAA